MTHEVTLTTLDGRRLWRRFDGRGRCVAAQDMPKQLTPEEVEQVFLHGFPVNEQGEVMKVRELIAELSKYDPEDPVCFYWDSCYSDVEQIVPSETKGLVGCPEVDVSNHDSLDIDDEVKQRRARKEQHGS